MVLVFDLILATRRKALTGIERFSLALYEEAKKTYPETYAIVCDETLVSTRDRVITVGRAMTGWLSLAKTIAALPDKDVVVVCAAFPASPSLVFSRCTVVRVLHDSFAWTRPQYMTNKGLMIFKTLEQALMRRNDIVVTPSRTSVSDLEAILKRPVGFCGNAAGLRPDPDEIRPPAGFAHPPGSFVLMVGTVEPRKNYDRVIRAGRCFAEWSVPIVIVGKPGWGDTVAKVREFCADNRSTASWLSQCSDGELAWLYGHCKAFVTLSHAEGFNMPLVEAGIFGSPILCSDLDVHRQVAPPWTVFLSDAADGEELARVACTLRPGIEPEAVLDYKTIYSWEKVLKTMMGIIESSTRA